MKHLESSNAPDICSKWLLKYGMGAIGYPVTIREQPSIPMKISEKRNNFIISLALFDLSQSV